MVVSQGFVLIEAKVGDLVITRKKMRDSRCWTVGGDEKTLIV